MGSGVRISPLGPNKGVYMSGKGSKPRPLSVDRETFNSNWDTIFKKPAWDSYSDLPSPEAYKNDYQDILSTEDCVIDAIDNLNKGETNGC